MSKYFTGFDEPTQTIGTILLGWTNQGNSQEKTRHGGLEGIVETLSLLSVVMLVGAVYLLGRVDERSAWREARGFLFRCGFVHGDSK